MGKKRIAIFVEKLYGGGVEKILQIICRNFDYDRLGFQNKTFCLIAKKLGLSEEILKTI